MRVITSLVILAAAFSTASCSMSRLEIVRSFQATFPIIEEMQVTEMGTGRCGYHFEYLRGKFLDLSKDDWCVRTGGGLVGYKPFDDQAWADRDSLLAALERNGAPGLHRFNARFGSDGHVTRASFVPSGGFLSMYEEYIYHPGHGLTAEDRGDSWCMEPVDQDWLRGWGC
jgi:hypothetical protein